MKMINIKDKNKMTIDEWVLNRTGGLSEIPALIPEVDTSSLLVESLKDLCLGKVEEDCDETYDKTYEIALPKNWKDKDEIESDKLDRLFYLMINKRALEKLVKSAKHTEKLVKSAKYALKKLKEIEESGELEPQEIAIAKQELEKEKKEAIELMKATKAMVDAFKDSQNASDYIESGSGDWLHNDKAKVMEIIDNIPIAKDEEVDNIVTASKLLKRIDSVLIKLDATISRIEQLLEISRDSKREKELEEEDNEDLTTEQLSKKIDKQVQKQLEEVEEDKLFKNAREASANDKIVSDAKIIKTVLDNSKIEPSTLEDIDKSTKTKDIDKGQMPTIEFNLEEDKEVDNKKDITRTPAPRP